MTVLRIVECEDCGNFYYVPGLVKDAREAMVEIGWSSHRGKDWCPDHKRDEEPDGVPS